MFAEQLYVTRPNLPSMSELSPMVEEMLRKRWVTNFGDFHKELEEELKKALGVKHVLLFCNGTIALFLLIRALELKGSVITTPFTFPATIHAIYMAGLEPLFCDVDPDTYTLDPEQAELKMSSSVSALLGVNVFGNACNINSLEKIGRKWNIPVIYDSAHAFFASYNNKMIGGFGKAEMFSFHATKLFTTLEGGAITTNDESLFKKMKLLINFGIKDEEHVVGAGLNGKMAEINAIFGLLSMKKMDGVLSRLSSLSKLYRDDLGSIPGIKFQKVEPGCRNNNQYMSIEIIEDEFGLDRDSLHRVLKDDNLVTRKYFYPAGHEYACYRECDFTRGLYLPNTERLTRRILCLPMYATLKDGDVAKICSLLRSVHEHRAQIKDKLKQSAEKKQ